MASGVYPWIRQETGYSACHWWLPAGSVCPRKGCGKSCGVPRGFPFLLRCYFPSRNRMDSQSETIRWDFNRLTMQRWRQDEGHRDNADSQCRNSGALTSPRPEKARVGSCSSPLERQGCVNYCLVGVQTLVGSDSTGGYQRINTRTAFSSLLSHLLWVFPH